MKIEVNNNIYFSDWHKPIITITQHEFSDSSKDDIETVIAMLCNLHCFEPVYFYETHEEILRLLNGRKNAKVFFGITSNTGDTERHLEIYIQLSKEKKLTPVVCYDKIKNESYLIKRTGTDTI